MRSVLKLGVRAGAAFLVWRVFTKPKSSTIPDDVTEGLSDFDPPNQHDVGDLYGVRANDVIDAEVIDDDVAMNDGQN